MDDIAIIAGLISGPLCWWAMAHSMKRNGRPWWWRHLAGALLAALAVVGVSMLLASIGGVSNDDGEPLGAGGAVMGLVVLLPIIIALVMSWRPSKRLPSSTPGPEPSQATEPVPARQGNRLRFLYEDAKGIASTREVTNWKDDGVYIEGYCHTAGDVRTFRRDRITHFLEGEHLLRPMAPKLEECGKGGGAMEILFTGFPNEERAQLEEDAQGYGLVVRKTVTKQLDFVCAGPRAGPTKLAKAREQGCTILDEDDFWSLVEDGVMPE
jgi:hypothetical protein